MSYTEMRRRNGELLPAIKSRFLKEIASGNLEERKTLRVTTMGRASERTGAGSNSSWLSRRQHEVPAWRKSTVIEADISQDEPSYVKGERVRHKLFGEGSIAEISGNGREVKAVIEFDDVNVGRKTIKLAYTTLERGFE
jgi:DNA helicase II / ATP-dependent DNA helicase PcrA